MGKGNDVNAPVLRGYGSYQYGQMHYRMTTPEETGYPPFLCLHMSPSSSRVYQRLLGILGHERMGLAPDAPGFGETDPPPHPLEISDFAKASFGLMDQLGITEPVDIMGYHTGSLTAAEMARQQPDRIRRIILVSTPMFTETELAEVRAAYSPSEFQEDGSHLTERWDTLKTWGDKAQTLDTIMEHFAEHIRSGDRYWWGVEAAFSFRMQDVLPMLEQAILLLNPADDLHEQTLRAVPMMQNGHIHELPDWSHGFMDLHTQELAVLIREFLNAE